MEEIQQITGMLELSFRGKAEWKGHAWHGPSVMETLREVHVSQIQNRISGSHSIIELVMHIAAWRIFVAQRLLGNNAYEVSEQENFRDSADWGHAIAELEKSQTELLSALKSFPASKLDELVPMRKLKYDFRTMLQGIIHHDLYHTGQIVLLKKISV